MTDVPADPGGTGPEPAAPSEPPVVRRSNYSPPPPGVEPPSFDDDALAEAMAAEVRPYTQPISLPKAPPVPPAVQDAIEVTPSAAPPEPPEAQPPVLESWNGLPMAVDVPEAPAADHPPTEPWPAEPTDAEPTDAEPTDAEPTDAEPTPAVDVSAEPSSTGPEQDELLRSLGGASTLEAIERLENELRLLSQGESPTIDLASAPSGDAVEAPVAEPPVAEPVAAEHLDGQPEPALDHPAPGHFFPAAFEPIAPLPTPGVTPLEAADEAQAPDAPEAPEAPEVPEVPHAPEAPAVPEVPDAPEVPEVPDAPRAEDAPDAARAPEEADAVKPAPELLEVDESLIDPAAAAELSAASPETASPWWMPSRPVDGAWDVAAPTESTQQAEESAVTEPLVPEPPVAEPLVPEPPLDEPLVPELPAAEPPAPVATPVPFSTEPPVGPEAPDWLDAPPPSYEPPELIEPPNFFDTSPAVTPQPLSNAVPESAAPASDAPVVDAAPLDAEAMAQLPKPLPTEQPKLEDRAELPPPPGYDDIPIMWGDVAAAPPPMAPDLLFPPTPAPPPLPDPSVMPVTLQAVTETPNLDHDEDDVIDEIDRVTGTGAIPVSSAGTADPLSPPSEPIATIRLSEDEPALVDEKPQAPSAFEVESAGPEPTALDMRAGRAARLFWLWFAANSSVLSLGLGAVLLGTGLSLRQAIVAALAGVAISFLPLGLGTLAGKWTGQPTMIVSRATFGHAGNILPALLAVATRVLWGGVLLWLLATAVAQVLVGARLDAGLGTTVWQLVGLVAGFVIATLIAVFGYGFVAKLQLVLSILSALLIVGAAALTYQHLTFSTALQVPDGSWILVIAGAALVFGVVGLAWVHSSSDVARYQRPASYGGSSMLWATFGATLPPFALIAWGAMLAASDPKLGKALMANPLAAIATLLPAWYPAPLLAAAGIGLLSGAVLTMYSGGFAIQALGVRARRSLTTFVSAILVLATAGALVFVVTDFGSLLRDLVITVAVPVAAWAGIFAAEMMIRTRRFHAESLLAPGGLYPQVRWLNFLALIVISGIGFGLVTSGIPGLGWEGFLYGLLGVGPHDPLASSDAGVFVALLLGILVPLIGGVPAIRKQERSPIPT